MEEISQTPESGGAAQEALTAALDNLDLRIRRASSDYRPETMRKYKAAVRAFFQWCQENGRQLVISPENALDYVKATRDAGTLRAHTLAQRVSALQYYAARTPGPLVSLVEARRLATLTAKADEADGVPPLYRVPKRHPSPKRRQG